jgi:dihydroxyacetone kinase
MTKVLNSAETFTDDAVAGMVSVYSSYLEQTYGGVVSVRATRPGKVAVVIGGGSGHYPAFAGWVGPGLADGAVVGNIFASPSTQQIYAVAKAVDDGAGVFMSYGNYAGDVLNFNLAEEQLGNEGIRAVSVPVTDDVVSAGLDEKQKRRGVAGDLMVFKIAGAAAERGDDLDGVIAAARKVNDATYSFGVAFAGCTLPGATEPLFTVPDGQMGVGLGVHGEPGVEEVPLESSSELATRLVHRLLEERPEGSSGRVAALLNGLGSTKYEELFVLWNDVRKLLEKAGLTLVQPEVGELITSLDMAGVSLTLTWLDEELEELWLAPADTPAFRRGAAPEVRTVHRGTSEAATAEVGPASDESKELARQLLDTVEAVATLLHDKESELGDLDAIAGDGDHGRGMTKGCDAALAATRVAVESGAGLSTALAAAGIAWADKAGGTSGALWGNGLRQAATALDDDTRPDAQQGLAAVLAAQDLVLTFGKAQRHDKTLLDALIPFTEALQQSVGGGESFASAWSSAAEVATTEAQATADLAPKIGRARVLSDRSQGHPDPGAISLAMILTAVGERLG